MFTVSFITDHLFILAIKSEPAIILLQNLQVIEINQYSLILRNFVTISLRTKTLLVYEYARGNDQLITMGQVSDILCIVIMKNRENILCRSCYTYLKNRHFCSKRPILCADMQKIDEVIAFLIALGCEKNYTDCCLTKLKAVGALSLTAHLAFELQFQLLG